MKTMTYQGYSARIEYSDEDGCFVGHIAGISDIIGFHGESVEALRSAFREAVEDYLETCKRLNRVPQNDYSGELKLQIPPEVHAAVAFAAKARGTSVDQWAADTLAHAVSR